MISRKTKYGLKALIYLVRHYNRGSVSISDLAKTEQIPQKFLEAILLELKNKGLLHSKKGKGGGYILGKPPDQITVGQIVRALEGPLAPVSCVSQTAYRRCDDCRDEETCCIRPLLKEVRDAIANVMDKMSLADVVRKYGSRSENSHITYSI